MSVDIQTVNPYQASRDTGAPSEAPEQYRALSSAAVVALVFGAVSLMAFLDYWLVVVPIVGLIWAVIALRQVKSRAGELTGRPLALIGLALSAVSLLVGPGWVYWNDISQVPPGYNWISYEALQPNPKTIGEIVPQSALDLNGKKVYIKGFVYAGSQTAGIKNFVLVRDAGTCCFGGNPKVTDRIVVTLGSASLIYTKNVARVSGVFRVNTAQAPGGIGVVYYHLDNAELR